MKRIANTHTNPAYHYKNNPSVPINQTVMCTEVKFEDLPKKEQANMKRAWTKRPGDVYVKYDAGVVDMYKVKSPYSMLRSADRVATYPDPTVQNSLCKWAYII